MIFSNPKSLKDLDNVVLLDTLLRGLKNEQDSISLRKLFKETINTHHRLFEHKVFTKTINKTEINPEGNNRLEYVLPTVRKVYSKFFIDLPGLFNPTNQYLKTVKDLRLELYQLQFNLEEFLTELSDKFKKNSKALNDFENLDSTTEIMTLIVENYVAGKLKYALEKTNSDIQSEIRDTKLNNQLGL